MPGTKGFVHLLKQKKKKKTHIWDSSSMGVIALSGLPQSIFIISDPSVYIPTQINELKEDKMGITTPVSFKFLKVVLTSTILSGMWYWF